jgi:antitoxin ParD1/3/4
MARNPSISLTEHQQHFINDLVTSGRYHGVSEVVRAGLRLLEDEEQRRITALESLKEGVASGLHDIKAGQVEDFDPETIIEAGEQRRSARLRSE